MQYDIIFITGEQFFDHPLCGIAILKRILEKKGYSVGIIEMPKKDVDIKQLDKPKLFFALTSGSMDSMVKNYTPLKKKRIEDKYNDYNDIVPDRATIVYSNWIKKFYKNTKIVIGGTESSLRRFAHYDYWDNKIRRSIIFDCRADILSYGNSEKQIIEIANKIKNKKSLEGIKGTCIISNNIPEDFKILPSFDQVKESKTEFCRMQEMITNNENLAQKTTDKYVLQYKMPTYTSKDLDHYYELDFSRDVPKDMRGFQFSIVTHRGCIGKCSFCSLNLLQGDRIISRSKESIIKEAKKITQHPYFKGNIDDLGGPSANMYGMDCSCENKNKRCIECENLDKSNKKLIELLRELRKLPKIKNVYIRSGIRFDLCSDEYLKELTRHHIYDTLRIAPEHTQESILKLMNKNKGNLKDFIKKFKATGTNKKLSYYFITGHPGSHIKDATQLAKDIKKLGIKDNISIQLFTPTPMTKSTCMYYTGKNPDSKKDVHVAYTYLEKKKQKRAIIGKQREEDIKDKYKKDNNNKQYNNKRINKKQYQKKSFKRFN